MEPEKKKIKCEVEAGVVQIREELNVFKREITKRVDKNTQSIENINISMSEMNETLKNQIVFNSQINNRLDITCDRLETSGLQFLKNFEIAFNQKKKKQNK